MPSNKETKQNRYVQIKNKYILYIYSYRSVLESHWKHFSSFIFEIEMLIFGNLLYKF